MGSFQYKLQHILMLDESLCFTKGTVNSYYSLCKNKWITTWHVCSGTYFVVINYIPLSINTRKSCGVSYFFYESEELFGQLFPIPSESPGWLEENRD